MNAIKQFLLKRVVRNVIAQGLKAVVAFVGASRLADWGVEVNLVLLTGAIMGGIELGWDRLKEKTGWSWL